MGHTRKKEKNHQANKWKKRERRLHFRKGTPKKSRMKNGSSTSPKSECRAGQGKIHHGDGPKDEKRVHPEHRKNKSQSK